MKFTNHAQYTMHAENVADLGKLADDIQRLTGLCTMVSRYHGAWEGQVSDCAAIVWIAPCEGNHDDTLTNLYETVCALTSSHCLMLKCETVGINCRCD